MAELNPSPSDGTWRKSTFSMHDDCMEVGFIGRSILLRDSLKPAGQVLAVSSPEWVAFLAGVRNGEFDLG